MLNFRALFVSLLLLTSLGLGATEQTTQKGGDDALVKACTLCHGPEGRSTPYGYFPRLAGKPETYLLNQLQNFQAGRRHYAQMGYLLENVDAAYLQQLAQFFAKQDIPYPAPAVFSTPPPQLKWGQELAMHGDPDRKIPACAACHGQQLSGGVSPAIPGLLGLPRDYLLGQMGNWRTDQRHAREPDCMAQIAKSLTEQDINAVTRWLATQAPLKQGPKPGSPSAPQPDSPALKCGSVQARHDAPLSPQQSQGLYLSRIGNCQACHTAQGGVPLAGGKAIETPFGVVYSSNLTPDAQTGIGRWSAADFWQALHEGRSKDGHLLTPAFPFTDLTQVSRQDADALFAYLQTLAPQKNVVKPNTLSWPFNTQWALQVWRALYFKPTAFKPDPKQTADWNRGAYLVNGLSHCGACHTPRNALGASLGDHAFKGAVLASQGQWVAPGLLSPQEGGVQNESIKSISNLLQNGMTQKGTVRGPMAEVVYKGTQYLSDEDAKSIGVYLKSLGSSAAATAAPVPQGVNGDSKGEVKGHSHGAALYKEHCEGCHGKEGQGSSAGFPALAGNRHVTTPHVGNLIKTVLWGGIPPTTAANPLPPGMPPFRTLLSDKDVADVLTYTRQSWGHQAPAITTLDVIQNIENASALGGADRLPR